MISSYRFIPIRLLLVAGLILSSCASFEPGLRLQELQRPRNPTAKASREGLEISVEEFISTAKSQMMFDTDIASQGLLAFLVRVENAGTEKYVARRSDMRALLNGQSLVPLSARDAANQAATSEYVAKALGWTIAAGPFAILLWPVTIGASAVHTHGVNKRIEQYFEASSYQDALLSPKQNAVGFIYFKLPDGVKSLDNLTVEAEAVGDGSGRKLSYKFDLPSMPLPK
ncbi:MAG: hypothetical protein HYY45_22495 [Deltaproteobacteria bacterium]|nr:hypothetical protein [Deltaproteobacteria bacterium]